MSNPDPSSRRRSQPAETITAAKNGSADAKPQGNDHPSTIEHSLPKKARNDEASSAARPADTKLALLESYEETVRPCIDLIDQLRKLGVDKDVDLPTIAVVGDQSAGKSSVLEALSGVQLPRGTGMVTRCPLELRMKNKPAGTPWRGRITYIIPSTGKEVAQEIKDSSNVFAHIQYAQAAIIGSKEGVSEQRITLEVESQDVPDLTLIDLPGIARVPAEGQPQNLYNQICNLITDNIKSEQTIILAVCPATADIHTTEALKMAQEHDVTGDRTIGVITKPDRVDRGAEKELIDVLLNKKLPLVKGYVCVKCRSQVDLDAGMTLKDSLTAEQKFFANNNNQHFRAVPSYMLGTESLANKLSKELVELIKKQLPELESDLKQQMHANSSKLLELGKEISQDSSERQNQFVTLMMGFCDKVQKLVEDQLNDDPEIQMHYNLRHMYTKFAQGVDSCSPGVKGSSFDKNRDTYLQELGEEIDRCRGSKLPRFQNYDVFRRRIKTIISDYSTPMTEALELVTYFINKAYDKLVNDYFETFPRLQSAVKSHVQGLIEAAKEYCNCRLKSYMQAETEMFAQDKSFTDKLETLFKSDTIKPPGFVFSTSTEYNAVKVRFPPQTMEMYEFIVSYIMIAKTRIADVVPLILMHELTTELGKKVRTSLMTEASLINSYSESPAVVRERQLRKACHHRLQQGLHLLKEYSSKPLGAATNGTA